MPYNGDSRKDVQKKKIDLQFEHTIYSSEKKIIYAASPLFDLWRGIGNQNACQILKRKQTKVIFQKCFFFWESQKSMS